MLDEAEAVEWVLERMPPDFRPLVVDNGSIDASPSIARSMGAQVVLEPARGFGAACYRGLLTATSDLVCFMDCDASLDPRDLPFVVAAVADDRADLVLGARLATKGSLPTHARLANRALSMEVRRRTNLKLSDIGPMRCARREALLGLGMRDRRFGWPLEMVLRAASAGWRVEEVSIPYHARAGRSKVTGTVRGTLRTVYDMARALA
jgi:glycosyltransferase involved in cell wall biosynthesis